MQLRSQTKVDNLIKHALYLECVNNAVIEESGDHHQQVILDFFSTICLIIKEKKDCILKTHAIAKIQEALDQKWLEPIHPQLRDLSNSLYKLN